MTFNKYCLHFVCLLLLFPILAFAQEKKKDWGKLSGSIELNTGYFFEDKKLGIKDVENPFAINTYLNLGYALKGFSCGLQYELYEPPMPGFDNLEGNKLIQGFMKFTHSDFSVNLGNMYEQFGSGLVLRSYEDRPMGINNSLLGANVAWRPVDGIALKGVFGFPRKYLKYADTRMYGVDAEVEILNLWENESDAFLLLGGSWVLRDDHSEKHYHNTPQSVNMYAGRLDFTKGCISLGGEYVAKSKSLYYDMSKGYLPRKGSALLMRLGVNVPGIGFSFEMRRLDNMGLRTDDNLEEVAVNMNYLPALTKQHKYMLASLFPHEVKEGEIGGQFDLFGEIPWGCLKENPIHFALNGSMYRKLAVKNEEEMEFKYFSLDGDLLFGEIGLELSRTFGKNFKGNLTYVHQKKSEFSKYGFGQMEMSSDILVGDFLYKFTKKNSLRMEVQHAWSDSKDDQRWVMGLLEGGFAPHWMVFVSDMYNYKSAGDSIHYYSVGGSYVWNNLRVSLSYARNRAGLQCSGGVCRYLPEYSGMNLLLTFFI